MEQGLEPEPELEPKPEPKLGFAASWSWGAEPKEIHIFGSATQIYIPIHCFLMSIVFYPPSSEHQ